MHPSVERHLQSSPGCGPLDRILPVKHSLLPLLLIAAGLCGLWPGQLPCRAQLRITEVMADNAQTLADEDGRDPDWIELHNAGAQSIDLAGWNLAADSASSPPWPLGSTNLPAGARLVVFASGRNRATPGLPFHTDFILRAEGDRVLLIRPDGITLESEVRFGPQRPDQSVGTGQATNTVSLIGVHAAARALIPGAGDADRAWTGQIGRAHV